MDNVSRYGFRFYRSIGDVSPEEGVIAASQSFDVNGGAANVVLGPGDPVTQLASGTFNLCDGAEGAGGLVAPYGIVIGVGPYWNAADGLMQMANGIPADVNYGTILDRETKIYVMPIEAAIWEIDCDDAVTATTRAAYLTLVGQNADWRLHGAAGETRAAPRLDISTHNTTNTLGVRITGISDSQENRDFSGAYVKLLVKANVIQFQSAGVAGI